MFDNERDSVLFGVCKPLGEYIGLDAVSMRIIFLLLFACGLKEVLFVYIVLGFLV